jgi:hypothetical protein
MTPTVIRLQPSPSGLQLSLHDAPMNGIAGISKPFKVKPTDQVFADFDNGGPENTAMAGQYLMDEFKSHPEVRAALDMVLNKAHRFGETSPIYIYLTPEAEAIPWETLRENHVHLTLDRRWPIGRMGSSRSSSTLTRTFTPPLRIMAVLAAAGIDATAQWDALWTSVTRAGFPIKLDVLVAQKDLLTTIQHAYADNVSVTASFLPPGREVFGLIRAAMPNVLHFFCHGESDGKFPWIELATRSGWKQPGHRDGRVRIEPNDFMNELFVETVWLVTLNCCKGAATNPTTGSLGSLVYSLVAQGFPAAAGMREAVTDVEANDFCATFYPCLFEVLEPIMTPNKGVRIEWANSLFESRMRFRTSNPPTGPPRWTIPLMYTRPAEFWVRTESPTPAVESSSAKQEERAMQTEMLVLERLLQEQLGAPDEILDRYRTRIAELQNKLYGAGDA